MNRITKFFRQNPSLDALILVSRDAATSFPDPNIHYFSGSGADSCLLAAFKEKEPTLFASTLVSGSVSEECGLSVKPFKGREVYTELAKELKGCKRVGIDADFLSVKTFSRLRKLGKKLVDVSGKLESLRAVKDEGEIKTISSACKLTKKIFKEVTLSQKKTEEQVANELQSITFSEGAEPAFKPIVLSGKRSRFPHAIPSKTVLGNNGVLIDYGVKLNDYCSDLTRCFNYSSKAGSVYSELKEMVGELADYAGSGMKASELAGKAGELVRQRGFPEMPHSVGHGIGLLVHESPSLSKKSQDILRKGSVFTLEPSVYLKDFGARFEETLALGSNKARIL